MIFTKKSWALYHVPVVQIRRASCRFLNCLQVSSFLQNDFSISMCRLKILECKRGRIYDIGFVDPYIVNEHSLHNHAKDTENNLVWALRKQEAMREIIFPYNFKWVLLSCTCYYFAYSMLSVNWWVMRVHRFHFILLVNKLDTGRVLVMDSKRKSLETWGTWLIHSRGNFNHYGTISATFVHFLISSTPSDRK
jgi:hypothetical protein